MARAPRPGSTGHRSSTNGSTNGSASSSGGEVYEISVRGAKVRLSTDMLGPRDDALVRRETLRTYGYKQSLVGALNEMNNEDTVGLDTVTLIWWLARRKGGEDNLSLSDALDAFPTYGEMERDAGVVDMQVVEPGTDDAEDRDSPEASGAASAPRGRPSPTSSASTRGTSRT